MAFNFFLNIHLLRTTLVPLGGTVKINQSVFTSRVLGLIRGS
jgi:hypothetical protein